MRHVHVWLRTLCVQCPRPMTSSSPHAGSAGSGSLSFSRRVRYMGHRKGSHAGTVSKRYRFKDQGWGLPCTSPRGSGHGQEKAHKNSGKRSCPITLKYWLKGRYPRVDVRLKRTHRRSCTPLRRVRVAPYRIRKRGRVQRLRPTTYTPYLEYTLT